MRKLRPGTIDGFGRGAQTVTTAEEFTRGGDRTAALEREVQELRARLAATEIAQDGSRIDGGDGLIQSVSRVRVKDTKAHSAGPSLAPFQAFVEQMREGALMVNSRGTIRYCNEAFARLLGSRSPQVIGRNLGEFIVGDAQRCLRRILGSEDSWLEASLRAGSGQSVPVTFSSTPPIPADGEMVIGLIVSDQRRQELRLRHEAMVQASKDAIYVLTPDLQIETWNRGAETIYGYAPSEIIGKSERDLCPRSEIAAFEDLVGQVQEKGAAVTVDVVRRRKDGSKIRMIYSLTPIREISGRTVGYAVVAHDVTEREKAARQLREAVARTALALEAGRMGTFELDFESKRCSWSDQVYGIFGLDSSTYQPDLKDSLELVHPEDRGLLQKGLEGAQRGEALELELRVRHSDGRYVWVQSRGLVRFDSQGNPQTLFGVISDITERKEAERRQHLLVGELNHRVRNTLATVQAIASQTLRRAKSPAEFVPSFTERIQALSRAHTLLTRSAWQGTDLDSLIREQLILGGSDRIICGGPAVSLEPQTALQLALVLHELGTNARKYGSLSVPQGMVSVNWIIEHTDTGPVLQLKWLERGGPPVTPPETTGFGTLLIERSLQQGQGGTSRISYDPDGLTCTIRLPLPQPDVLTGMPGQSSIGEAPAES